MALTAGCGAFMALLLKSLCLPGRPSIEPSCAFFNRAACAAPAAVIEVFAMTETADSDTRTPSPPWGYSQPCTLSPQRQVEVVAQYHAHHIRPNRIAYRTGIDIALVEALIAGERDAQRFAALLTRYRRQRYRERMQASTQERAGRRYELQQRIEQEFHQELAGLAPTTTGPS
jgi:hypothetical protein